MSRAACNIGAVLLSQELKPKGVPVLMLHPGFNKTGMTAKYAEIWEVEGKQTLANPLRAARVSAPNAHTPRAPRIRRRGRRERRREARAARGQGGDDGADGDVRQLRGRAADPVVGRATTSWRDRALHTYGYVWVWSRAVGSVARIRSPRGSRATWCRRVGSGALRVDDGVTPGGLWDTSCEMVFGCDGVLLTVRDTMYDR